jgi:hypothetical protein
MRKSDRNALVENAEKEVKEGIGWRSVYTEAKTGYERWRTR